MWMPAPSPDSIPSIPTEAASKHGLNLEPESFKVSWKLFYQSKISASRGAVCDQDWGCETLLREMALNVLSEHEPGTRRELLRSTVLCRRSDPTSLWPPALQADAQLE